MVLVDAPSVADDQYDWSHLLFSLFLFCSKKRPHPPRTADWMSILPYPPRARHSKHRFRPKNKPRTAGAVLGASGFEPVRQYAGTTVVAPGTTVVVVAGTTVVVVTGAGTIVVVVTGTTAGAGTTVVAGTTTVVEV